MYGPVVAARKTKGTWGGWRPGAGRKPVLKEPRRITLDVEGADFAALESIAQRRETSVAETIRIAIRSYLKRQRGLS